MISITGTQVLVKKYVDTPNSLCERMLGIHELQCGPLTTKDQLSHVGMEKIL